MGKKDRQRAEIERMRAIRPPETPRCALCHHAYDARDLTKHHVVPKSRGGTDTVPLCKPCHKQVHALFTERELEERYGTVELLESAEALQPFLRFIRKRKPTKKIGVRTAKSKGR